MDSELKTAYHWAKTNQYHYVAAEYAALLASHIDDLYSIIALAANAIKTEMCAGCKHGPPLTVACMEYDCGGVIACSNSEEIYLEQEGEP